MMKSDSSSNASIAAPKPSRMIQKYRKHTFHGVYGNVDEDLQKEIAAFWTRNQAISDRREALRRTREVVLVIRNAADEIAGITSVYLGHLDDGIEYYFYRIFIQCTDRAAGMMRAATRATRVYLRDHPVPDGPPAMIIVTENPKLMRKGMRRMFSQDECVYLGKTANGCDRWSVDCRPAAKAEHPCGSERNSGNLAYFERPLSWGPTFHTEVISAKANEVKPAAPAPPLRSVHTAGFAPLLEELGISLLVSTYQAGKLVVLRADGAAVNTHFRTFQTPMGIAYNGERLAVGTAMEIWEFHNAPAVARNLEPAGKHDACFLPRTSHVTGNVQMHEMAWANAPASGESELWFVNTRFSCLATRDANRSFVPRWQPPFISALAPEDRCHLNGIGIRDGRPRYVTALGETDTPGGWRANKKSGGILIDVPSGAIVARGLSMPHSPRWHDGRLWVLDSGNGGINAVDEPSGRVQSIAALPGFTRGLDFYGRYAFVGLSQVRETAVFSGIAIAELPERKCGVWVVDIHTGHTVAFLRFEDALQEIFAVQVLPNRRYPDIVNDNYDLIGDSFLLESR